MKKNILIISFASLLFFPAIFSHAEEMTTSTALDFYQTEYVDELLATTTEENLSTTTQEVDNMVLGAQLTDGENLYTSFVAPELTSTSTLDDYLMNLYESTTNLLDLIRYMLEALVVFAGGYATWHIIKKIFNIK